MLQDKKHKIPQRLDDVSKFHKESDLIKEGSDLLYKCLSAETRIKELDSTLTGLKSMLEREMKDLDAWSVEMQELSITIDAKSKIYLMLR